MVKFRLHRGGLSESMETVKEFDSEKQLINHIQEVYSCKVRSLIFEYQKYDKRVDWETYLVITNTETMDCFPVGYSDGTFNTKRLQL